MIDCQAPSPAVPPTKSPAAFSHFVAIGDSFTAGLPEQPHVRPWADLLAAALRARNPVLSYVNLAAKNATTTRVAGRQLPGALARHPDLLSVICGGNDVLLSRHFDPDRFERRFRAMIERARSACPDVTVVTCSCADFGRFLPVDDGRRAELSAAIRELNVGVERAACELGALFVDFRDDGRATRRELWGDDGLHPSAAAHTAVAELVLAALDRRGGESQREISDATA